MLLRSLLAVAAVAVGVAVAQTPSDKPTAHPLAAIAKLRQANSSDSGEAPEPAAQGVILRTGMGGGRAMGRGASAGPSGSGGLPSGSAGSSGRTPRIMVRNPPVRVEPQAGSGPVSLPVRPALSGTGRAGPAGSIAFPNDQLQQQADDRLDAVAPNVWDWDELKNGCGITKSCLGVPAGCDEDGVCIAIATVEVIDEHFVFRLRASDASWVAVGLGETNKMVANSSGCRCQ